MADYLFDDSKNRIEHKLRYIRLNLSVESVDDEGRFIPTDDSIGTISELNGVLSQQISYANKKLLTCAISAENTAGSYEFFTYKFSGVLRRYTMYYWYINPQGESILSSVIISFLNQPFVIALGSTGIAITNTGYIDCWYYDLDD